MILDRVSVIAAMAKKNITIAELSSLSTVSIPPLEPLAVAAVLPKTVPNGLHLRWISP